jgi:hypothetical protein
MKRLPEVGNLGSPHLPFRGGDHFLSRRRCWGGRGIRGSLFRSQTRTATKFIDLSPCGGGDGHWWFHRNLSLQPALKMVDLVKIGLADTRMQSRLKTGLAENEFFVQALANYF